MEPKLTPAEQAVLDAAALVFAEWIKKNAALIGKGKPT
jgi:hypothetical protein